MNRLPRSFYLRDARQVARELIGRILVSQIGEERTAGRIIEAEAYLGSIDPASHCHRGPTQRNRSMFLQGGHAYVYFIYGMYYCFNVVSGEAGEGQGILIRGLEPLEGLNIMRERRGGKVRRDPDLTNGPGKLAIALGIGPELDGADLITDSRIWLEEGEMLPDNEVITTARIGITKAVEHPWRWVRKPNEVRG